MPLPEADFQTNVKLLRLTVDGPEKGRGSMIAWRDLEVVSLCRGLSFSPYWFPAITAPKTAAAKEACA
jgi:hypothetical protein